MENEIESAVTTSTEIAAIAEALSKAQGKMTGAIKDSNNPFFKSQYADLASVMDAIRQPFADNGLSYTQLMSGDVNFPVVTTILMHSSGQWIKSSVSSSPGKKDIQGQGAVTTYLRRFSLSAIAGVAQVDRDGEDAVARGEQVSTEPVDMDKVKRTAKQAMLLVDDDPEDYSKKTALSLLHALSNDERIALQGIMKAAKPTGTNKTYYSCFKDHMALERKAANNQADGI